MKTFTCSELIADFSGKIFWDGGEIHNSSDTSKVCAVRTFTAIDWSAFTALEEASIAVAKANIRDHYDGL